MILNTGHITYQRLAVRRRNQLLGKMPFNMDHYLLRVPLEEEETPAEIDETIDTDQDIHKSTGTYTDISDVDVNNNDLCSRCGFSGKTSSDQLTGILLNSPSDQWRERIKQTRPKKQVAFKDDTDLISEHIYYVDEFLETFKPPGHNDCETRAGKFQPLFHQPAENYKNLTQRVNSQHVCLENALGLSSCVEGSIRALPATGERSVYVRFTTNGWDSFCNIPAREYPHGQETFCHDIYTFTIDLELDVTKVEFALCYRTNDAEFWDNNDGKNYVMEYREKVTL